MKITLKKWLLSLALGVSAFSLQPSAFSQTAYAPSTNVLPGSVTLAWSPPMTNSVTLIPTAGNFNYTLWYGVGTNNYTNGVGCGTNLIGTVTNLAQGTVYSFAVTTTDTNMGLTGPYSAPLTWSFAGPGVATSVRFTSATP